MDLTLRPEDQAFQNEVRGFIAENPTHDMVGPIGPDHAVAAMARYLNTRAHSIYGGSNEIQRNIMAKLVLGL